MQYIDFRKRIYIMILGAILVFLFSTGAIYIISNLKTSVNEMAVRGEGVSRLGAQLLKQEIDSLSSGEDEAVKVLGSRFMEFADSLFRDRDVTGVALTDGSGNILIQKFRTIGEAGGGYSEHIKSRTTDDLSLLKNRDLFTFFMPQGQEGAFFLAVSFSCLRAYNTLFMQVLLLISIAALFVLISWIGYRNVSKHYDSSVDMLIESVKKIDITDIRKLQERIPYIRTRKTDELIDTFNTMLLRFRKNIAKIEAQINIGKALSLEKDSYMLFHTILYYSKILTFADAGSIFLVEKEPGTGNSLLRVKYSSTFSKNLPYEEVTIPLDKESIVGYVASIGRKLNIADVYTLPPNSPYHFNRDFDRTNNYRTKSVLTIPIKNPGGDITGVIQLLNCKESKVEFTGEEAFKNLLVTDEDFENKVVPFEPEHESLIESVAAQAAIALENLKMIRQIEFQFEEFVKASVTAIESRDPATSGHSFRVADLCVRMAKAINNETEGPFKEIIFSTLQMREMTFAALLHDFGKIYIDPNIFLKAKRLYPHDMKYWDMKSNFLYKSIEAKYSKLKETLYKNPGDMLIAQLEYLEKEKNSRLDCLLTVKQLVHDLNEPVGYLENREEVLNNILEVNGTISCEDLAGNRVELFDDEELVDLKIPRGTLNNTERRIIESHVEHSYTFVKKIPWPEGYRNIPEIVRNHHEKLNGSGYPRGIKGKERIPLQARMITVADIFDALTAADRPYKKGVPLEKVLSILMEEAARGELDRDLVHLFVDKRLYEK